MNMNKNDKFDFSVWFEFMGAAMELFTDGGK